MNKASCLCGAVAWEFTGEPKAAYHCHCTACRKHHAAAFGTYYLVDEANFRWVEQGTSIRKYRSSESLERAFCSDCGSVVPEAGEKGSTDVYVPAGPHGDGPEVQAHIFTGSKAPWYDITDGLEQHEQFPDGMEQAVYDTPEPRTEDNGHLRGSCLCGAVAYEVLESFSATYHCHCSRCRKARAAAFTSNGFTSGKGIRFLRGYDNVRRYAVPEAELFAHAFCKTCGSGMPRFDEEKDFGVVPFGSLDDDPGAGPAQHIFVADKASWYDITDDLPQFEQGPQ